MFSQPKAVAFASGILGVFSIVPGLPKLPFMILAGFFGVLFLILRKSNKKILIEEEKEKEVKKSGKNRNLKNPLKNCFMWDRMGIEVGYRLVPLVDPQKNGGILERINALRRQMARDMGIMVPPIRVRDNCNWSKSIRH